VSSDIGRALPASAPQRAGEPGRRGPESTVESTNAPLAPPPFEASANGYEAASPAAPSSPKQERAAFDAPPSLAPALSIIDANRERSSAKGPAVVDALTDVLEKRRTLEQRLQQELVRVKELEDAVRATAAKAQALEIDHGRLQAEATAAVAAGAMRARVAVEGLASSVCYVSAAEGLKMGLEHSPSFVRLRGTVFDNIVHRKQTPFDIFVNVRGISGVLRIYEPLPNEAGRTEPSIPKMRTRWALVAAASHGSEIAADGSRASRPYTGSGDIRTRAEVPVLSSDTHPWQSPRFHPMSEIDDADAAQLLACLRRDNRLELIPSSQGSGVTSSFWYKMTGG
jgi:hypothetical protein